MDSIKTLVIIPAYNEEDCIEHTVSSLRATCPDVDYLVVNDGSTDHTKTICWRNRYNYLDLSVNLGLSGAFQAGVKYAYEHDYDCVIQFDADGQHRPECIPLLMANVENHDIVIGSRFINHPRKGGMRMIGSRILSGAIHITTGKHITDPTSGFRAFGKKMIRSFAYSLNFAPEPDTISFLIRNCQADVVEVPVEMAERYAGESYFNIKSSSLYMLRMAFSILFIQFFRKKGTVVT